MAKNYVDDATLDDDEDQPFAITLEDAYGASQDTVAWTAETAATAEIEATPLIIPQTDTYERFRWENGYLPFVDIHQEELRDSSGNVLKLRGLCIAMKKIGDVPISPALKKAIEKAVQDGRMTVRSVRHSDGAIKEYAQFVDGKFKMFPLFTKLPKLTRFENDMIPNDCYRKDGPLPSLDNLCGVVAGRKTWINKKDLNQSTYGYCGCLMVVDALWDAGYVDEVTGLPIPLVFEGTSFGMLEFYNNVLIKHMRAVQVARTLKPEWANMQPWMLGLVMKNSIKTVKRKSAINGQESEAYAVWSEIPNVVDAAYVASMFAGSGKGGAERLAALKQLVYECYRRPDGSIGLRPGGAAVRWSAETALFTVQQQRKDNPNSDKFPLGELKFGAKRPLSVRLMKRLAPQTATQAPEGEEEQDRTPRKFNTPTVNAQRTATTMVSQNEGVSEDDIAAMLASEGEENTRDYYAEVSDLIGWFAKVKNQVQVEALTTLAQAMEDGTCTMEEMERDIAMAQSAKDKLIAAAAARKKNGFRAQQ